jgi:hypothetical protein
VAVRLKVAERLVLVAAMGAASIFALLAIP